jgi:hypothetical protein
MIQLEPNPNRLTLFKWLGGLAVWLTWLKLEFC